MPRKLLMGFEKATNRWRKMYKGERYEVYCSSLNLPPDQWTELGSYQAANEWWLAKRAEIDGRPPALRPDVEEVVAALRRKREVLADSGQDATDYDEAIREAVAAATKPLIDPRRTFATPEEEIDAVVRASQPEGDGVNVLDPRTSARAAFLAATGVDLAGVDPTVLEIGLGSDSYWREMFAAAKQVPEDRRVGRLLDGWVVLKAKKAKPTTLIRLLGVKKAFECLKHDEKVVLSADMAVDVLTEQRVEEVFHALDAENRNAATKHKKWVIFKSFVRYVVKKRLVPLPLNLDDKLLSFGVTPKEKPKPVLADVRDFIAGLPERLRLYALLAANCGMNNVDIGKLEPRQIDLAAKTLTRKRVKTASWKDVPTVTYRLWDETAELLRRQMTAGGQYALLDARGQPLYLDSKEGAGAAKLYDKIKSSWRDHFGRDGAKKYTIKDFRFISADIIKDDPQYRAYREAWLGHSPKTVAERNYSSSEDCTHVCEWLHARFFPKT